MAARPMMQCMIAGIGMQTTIRQRPRDRMTRAYTPGRPHMTKWIRFEQGGKIGIGTLEGDTITVHTGDVFAGAKPSGQTLKLSEVQVRTPCQPSKMICLWNNFHQLAAKNDFQQPKEPLWFLKAPNSYWPANRPIERPATYAGKIIYEGELGVVIGKKCFNISEAEAGDYIFGYTCVNDVTAVDLLRKDKSFEQWARSKSFDTFGVIGPVIATGLDPMKLSIKTVLNGTERQNYPVADMFFPPHRLVAAISKDVTLMPGDIIACGTSLGAGTMADAHNVVDIVIDGVGSLSNVFDPVLPSPYLFGAPPKQKKICIVGAGAIGGLLAAKFALAGEDVTVIDQGAHLAAIQKNGLKLEWHDGKVQTARMKAVNKAADAGKQDIVVLAVKAHFLDQVVRDIDSMLGPDTVVLTVQNGLPWWYFQKLGGQYDNHRLASLDPSGVLTGNIDPNRIIGCVVYPAAAATAPGVIHHVEGDRFPIGELDGKQTGRVKELHDVFIKAGLKSLVLPDIRSEIWLKAWGNLSFNPISALTHATLVDICQFAETRELAANMMKEAQDIAQKLGVTFRVTIDKRIAGAEAVYALVKLLNKVMLLEGGGVKVEKTSKAA